MGTVRVAIIIPNGNQGGSAYWLLETVTDVVALYLVSFLVQTSHTTFDLPDPSHFNSLAAFSRQPCGWQLHEDTHSFPPTDLDQTGVRRGIICITTPYLLER